MSDETTNPVVVPTTDEPTTEPATPVEEPSTEEATA
jgi:hypothetical protein